MKTNKTISKSVRTARATPAKKTPDTAASKKVLSVAKTPAAKSTPASPLTSARVTKAAANAKKALAPAEAKLPKLASPKKPKAPVKPKSSAGNPPPLAAQQAKGTAAPPPAQLAPQLTTIEAFIDVGFGNRLTLRGEGAGLSWERGVTMNCLGSAEWGIALEGAEAPLCFKFLLNDEHWSAGENYTLAPGKTGAFTPEF